MIDHVSAEYITKLAESVGLALADGEIAELATHLERQFADFCALSGVDTDGAQPSFDVNGGNKYKLERSEK